MGAAIRISPIGGYLLREERESATPACPTGIFLMSLFARRLRGPSRFSKNSQTRLKRRHPVSTNQMNRRHRVLAIHLR